MGLTRFSINRPTIVAMLFIALAVMGVMSYRALGVNLFPNVSFPIVVVSANYPGASPAEMEKLIVKPIEDEIDGIPNLDKMTAIAQEGRANVIVQFKLDTDLNLAGIDVQRRVDTARINMPSDLDPPLVSHDAGSTASDPIIEEALSSNAISAAALSDITRDSIVPELKRVAGVDAVNVRGEAKREIQVLPDNSRLIATGATLSDLFGTIARNNANLPGGRIDSPTEETSVSVHADIVQPQDILLLPLAVPGGANANLTVGNVAAVVDGHVEQRIVSHFNGAPTVILDVTRQLKADTLKTTDLARKAMAAIAAKHPQIQFKEIDASADYTRASLDGVLQNLVEGILLTALVMLLFLHAWRNALVVMIAIPTSLLATFIVMRVLGFTVDIISLMGLGLTIGILVDDSIVVLENITRHRDLGEAAFDAAINGRSEIGGAAVAITLVDVVVFLPIAFLSGIVGKYMQEFGIVIVVATLFSLLVSFTLTPLLAARWAVKHRSQAAPRALAWFQHGFEALMRWYKDRALPFALAHRYFTAFCCALLVLNAIVLPAEAVLRKFAFVDLAIAAGVFVWFALSRGLQRLRRGSGRSNGAPVPGKKRMLFVTAAVPAALALACAIVPPIGSEFIPSSDTGTIRGTVTYPVGTPLAVTQAGLNRFENRALKIDGLDMVITTTGVKPSGFGSTIGGNVARITAILNKKRRRETDRVLTELRKLDFTLPGAKFVAFKEGGGGGGGEPIYFTLSGPDATLNAAANKLAALIRSVPGTINVQTGAESEAPRLNIHIDPVRCALLGVAPGDAATAARIAIGGAVATKVRTASGLIDVRLELPVAQRNTVEEVRRIRVRSNAGQIVELADVAELTTARAPTKIERQNRERVVRVTGGIDANMNVSMGAILGPINAALKQPGFLPPGTKALPQGDSELFAQTFSSMALALATSFVLVYMLMVILYGSFVEPFVIMFSVPLALVGALGGLALRHQTLNLFSMIAVIMLFGLVAKNGILLVDYANTMRRRGLRVVEAMVAAAGTRFRPILMTTCAMVFGMLPLSLGLAEGARDRASMGTVLIGGLISSLILTLFLVPVVYSWIMGRVERRQDARALRQELAEPVRI